MNNNNNNIILGPGNAITNNSTKHSARKLLRGIVNPEFFNNAWDNRYKNMNYSIWNKNGEFVGFSLISLKRNIPKTPNKKGKLGLYINLISAKKRKRWKIIKTYY